MLASRRAVAPARGTRTVARTPARRAHTLVVADHNNKVLNPGTLNTIAAASRVGHPVSVLIAGNGAQSAAKLAARAKGTSAPLTAAVHRRLTLCQASPASSSLSRSNCSTILRRPLHRSL